MAVFHKGDPNRVAQILSEAHRLADAVESITREPADAFAARLRRAHPHGTVVVAGHSNTVPAIVAALCSCQTAAMDEGEFDRISTVRIDAYGGTRVEMGSY